MKSLKIKNKRIDYIEVNKFIETCKNEITFKNSNRYLKDRDGVKIEVKEVWFCKTLQNMKALFCVKLGDKILKYYYECTYNGNKNEIYICEYDKVSNECIKLED